MIDDQKVPEAGDECPICEYSPVYEDGGEIICPGCDTSWPKPEEE